MSDDVIQVIEYRLQELKDSTSIPKNAIIIHTEFFKRSNGNGTYTHYVRCLIRYLKDDDIDTEIKEDKNDINYS